MFGASVGSWSSSQKKSNFFSFRCGLKPWAVLLHALIKIRANDNNKKKKNVNFKRSVKVLIDKSLTLLHLFQNLLSI
jgi:hypothetical protein